MAPASDRERDQLLQALGCARLGFWTWDAASGLVAFSARTAEILGVPPGLPVPAEEMQALIVEQDRDPLTRGELARLVLLGDAIRAATELRFGTPPLKLRHALLAAHGISTSLGCCACATPGLEEA